MVSLPAFLTSKAVTTMIFNHGGPLAATGSCLLDREATAYSQGPRVWVKTPLLCLFFHLCREMEGFGDAWQP